VARALLLVSLILALVPIDGCARDRVERGLPLLNDFQSLESPDSVRARLEAQGVSWNVLEDTRLPDSDTRPPYALLRWGVPRYEVAGISGTLELVFFNDRLGRAEFTPENPAAFRKAVAGELPELGGRVQDGDRLVESIARAEGAESLRWDDVRVMQALREWLRQYS
jgi:hypothetical protein